MTNQRERNEEKRAKKLREIDEAIDDGRLVVRSMTDAERKAFPARDQPPKRPRRGKSG